MTAYAWLCEYLRASGSAQRMRLWQCPSHDDASPSLAVTEGAGGRALIHCFAGCAAEEVLAALGLAMNVLFRPHPLSPEAVLQRQLQLPSYPPIHHGRSAPGRARGMPTVVTHHVYARNAVRLERARFANGDKACRWETRSRQGWTYGLGFRKLSWLPLYEIREVRKGIALGDPIVLCESESSVDALLDAGIFATTWAGGAGSEPIDLLRSTLTGAKVVLIPDHDQPGLQSAQRITQALDRVCDLRTVLPPLGLDARDLLASHGPDGMAELVMGRNFSPVAKQ